MYTYELVNIFKNDLSVENNVTNSSVNDIVNDSCNVTTELIQAEVTMADPLPIQVTPDYIKFCYKCHSVDHLGKDCTNRKAKMDYINANPELRKILTAKRREGYKARHPEKKRKRNAAYLAKRYKYWKKSSSSLGGSS